MPAQIFKKQLAKDYQHESKTVLKRNMLFRGYDKQFRTQNPNQGVAAANQRPKRLC